MKLQISTRLALCAALQLAADPAKQFAAAEIAQHFGISVNHLAKVLRTLGRAGLVEAVRGARGGYRFRGNAKRITLLDVIQLFEDVAADRRDEPAARTSEERTLRRVLDEIDDVARATLSSITLATMLKLVGEPSGEGGPPPTAPEAAASAPPRAARGQRR